MRTPRVLVTYGTKNGSTAEIAQWIADAFRAEGLEPDVFDARRVDDVDDYDAVVLGGALYANRWHKDARHFVQRFRRDLAGRPVWLFSSGPLDDTAGEKEIAPVKGVAKAMQQLDARGHATFGGRLDESADAWIAKKMVSSGHGGDFRNREQITTWAVSIAAALDRSSLSASA
jgi:menaquinone-dependent protoporphyrinogen oxidase